MPSHYPIPKKKPLRPVPRKKPIDEDMRRGAAISAGQTSSRNLRAGRLNRKPQKKPSTPRTRYRNLILTGKEDPTTRGISREDLKSLLVDGVIDENEYASGLDYLDRLEEEDLKMNPSNRKHGGMIKAKKKKQSGAMAGKKSRVGHVDFRKGGMVYKTTKE